MLVFAGIHEADLKHPFLVPPKNGKRVKGNTAINLKIIDKEEFSALRADGQVMSTLASLVQDDNGNVLGEVIPKDDFDHLKKTLDTSHLLGKKRESDFKDSFKKAALRQLFRLFT
ncbi:MAG: hypothetical protein WCJ39_03565 [bacterium]